MSYRNGVVAPHAAKHKGELRGGWRDDQIGVAQSLHLPVLVSRKGANVFIFRIYPLCARTWCVECVAQRLFFALGEVLVVRDIAFCHPWNAGDGIAE